MNERFRTCYHTKYGGLNFMVSAQSGMGAYGYAKDHKTCGIGGNVWLPLCRFYNFQY